MQHAIFDGNGAVNIPVADVVLEEGPARKVDAVEQRLPPVLAGGGAGSGQRRRGQSSGGQRP